MVALSRLVVSAPSTGQGKTTIATGLMAAIRAAGHEVSGHKVGPDYIDPGYHTLATGRPGRNVDPHLVGEERVVPLLLHGAAGADIAVIEGVMGLFDGRLGSGGFASTAHVATLTETPVVLVLDVARLSRSAGAIALGLARFDAGVRVAGVILNQAGSERNVAEIVGAMEQTGLPVLGVMPRNELLSAPARHLGLVPAAERDGAARMIEELGEQVARHLDLDALWDIARSAPDLDAEAWRPGREVLQVGTDEHRPIVAMAGGRAFTFRYPETEELLRAAGCEVIDFDPLVDPALPAGTQGIYLGGGFPEVYLGELAGNRSLLEDLRNAVAAGTPTVAECAGLLYLCETLDGAPMAGVLPATAAMAPRLVLRYPVARAATDSVIAEAGEQVTGHEFHRTRTDPAAGESAAWTIDGESVGFVSGNLHASYLHLHWAGHPRLAQRFAEAVHAAPSHVASAAEPARAGERTHVRMVDPLRHHGDAETGQGLVDFAVNVYAGDRPAWLERALYEGLAAAAAYPDPEPARAAIAQRHGRDVEEVLATSGAAEAFTLIAQSRAWRRPVVVHPQFTEPHAALEQAGHAVTTVLCRPRDGFRLDPDAIPEDADLVVVGNPTNPTGVIHPAPVLRGLRRPGRLVVVDEAFMDAVPGEVDSLAEERLEGLVVVRSLTKHWTIPGIRAGYLVGDPAQVRRLAGRQTPWSVSAPAIAAMIACCEGPATVEARERAATLARWRGYLHAGLRGRGIEHPPSAAPFVLTRLGRGGHAALRERGVAVRRADTFPGLDPTWVRVAVRPPETTDRFFDALDAVRLLHPTPCGPP